MCGSGPQANERSEDNFCSMKITQEVRDFAAKQNQESTAFIAADVSSEDSVKEEVEAGMAEMAEKYRDGGDLYVPADS